MIMPCSHLLYGHNWHCWRVTLLSLQCRRSITCKQQCQFNIDIYHDEDDDARCLLSQMSTSIIMIVIFVISERYYRPINSLIESDMWLIELCRRQWLWSTFKVIWAILSENKCSSITLPYNTQLVYWYTKALRLDYNTCIHKINNHTIKYE